MNPDEFDIETKKLMGLWPNPNSLAFSILPYAKRMKGKIAITMLGDSRGENAREFIDGGLTPKRINLLGEKDKYVFDSNVPDQSKIKYLSVGDDEIVGTIGVENQTVANLERQYKLLKKGGLFCGTDHDKEEVKVALQKFRRDNHIGTPINVANLSTWFWIKA